jgi:hypothetical protein
MPGICNDSKYCEKKEFHPNSSRDGETLSVVTFLSLVPVTDHSGKSYVSTIISFDSLLIRRELISASGDAYSIEL